MIRKIRDFIIGFRFKKYGHRKQREFKNISDNKSYMFKFKTEDIAIDNVSIDRIAWGDLLGLGENDVNYVTVTFTS